MRKLVSALNRSQRRRLAWRRWALRTLAAALVAGGALASQPASAVWSPGLGAGSYGSFDLTGGLQIDVDGDGNADFALEYVVGYGGDTIYLTPETVNSVNNEVFASLGLVTPYATPQDVLDAVTNGDPTVAAPGAAVLWDSSSYTTFESGGLVGLLFEIPGGSPYVAYLDLDVTLADGVFDQLVVNETGFQPVPEPGTATLLLGGGLLGLAVRRRSRIR